MNSNSENKQRFDKVLVIDDDENWCFIATKILQKAGIGQKILTHKNGLEAFKNLQKLSDTGEPLPDLIFLDIKMPVMDGFEFLEAVNQSEKLALNGTKIFICSSSMHPRDKERSARFPIAGFINKPFTPEVLADILSE